MPEAFAKGTHIENTQYRETFKRQRGELKNLLNVVPSTKDLELEPIRAPAGTVVIFDTDTLHKGGLVQLGKERRVIRMGNRFPTQPASMRHKRFSQNWWLSRIKSPAYSLNIVGRISIRGTSRSFTSSKSNYASLALKKIIKLASNSNKR